MTEKKKLSVAEILAAARKSDGKTSSENAGSGPAPAEPAAPAEVTSAATPSEAPAPAKPAAPKPGGRLSTADILAAARANKTAAPAAEAKPAAPKPAAPKPAAKEPAAEKAAPIVTAEKDTASILAAARKEAKPGPMSKAEAAAKTGAHQPGAAAEPKAKKQAIIVPPMPAKPAYAQKKPAKDTADENRRGFISLVFGSFLGIGFFSLGVVSGLWSLGIARFMFPNILTEPPSTFKVGSPADFPPGAVSEKFKAQFGVWVVNGEYNGQSQIYALKTVCTHLGCTPNWLEAEQKFKCPCHGSGFYKDGINFEGPAPRPLERYAIRLADDGQLEIDKSKTFQEEMGAWSDPSSFVAV